MSTDDRRWQIFLAVVGIAAAVGALVAGFYFLSWVLPYLVFYIVPFLILSIAMGFVFKVASVNLNGGVLSDGSYPSDYVSKYSYRQLAVAIPVLAFVGYLAFHASPNRPVVVDRASGVYQGIGFEWPWVNQKFNDVRTSVYTNSSFDSLRAKLREPETFDRSDVGLIFWVALLLGGPAFFFYLSADDEDHERECMLAAARAATKVTRDRLDEERRDQRNVIENEKRPLLNQVRELERLVALANSEAEKLKQENQLLKAKIEFSPDVKSSVKKAQAKVGAGVLDGELL